MDYSHKSYADKVAKKDEGMLVAPAGERNKQYILDVLQSYLPDPGVKGQVLEIASGPGQHVAFFASQNLHITWQPSDLEEEYLKSISAHISSNGLDNVLPPIRLDITKPEHTSTLAPKSLDVVLNVNMIHISPWETSQGLFKTAGCVLKSGGVLFMYGPFKIHGSLTPDSNVQFDARLRSQDSRWGIRDIDDLENLAKENGLKFEKMVDMPANNKCTIFRKE
ncbi:methyltransferase-like 26 [Aplysia californica]|uniref:Methyltransferase-like 26 n=1 Tax=Aplysia californica TaxID=6500 RepID=A0ABM0JYA5_APLCA|nr:methyltransferase-like 26 [Aplysia californica]